MKEIVTNYKEIFNLSHHGYFIINEKYNIIYKNEKASKLLNTSNSDNLSDLIDDSNLTIFSDNLNLVNRAIVFDSNGGEINQDTFVGLALIFSTMLTMFSWIIYFYFSIFLSL